jgi:hypothetical protein
MQSQSGLPVLQRMCKASCCVAQSLQCKPSAAANSNQVIFKRVRFVCFAGAVIMGTIQWFVHRVWSLLGSQQAPRCVSIIPRYAVLYSCMAGMSQPDIHSSTAT